MSRVDRYRFTLLEMIIVLALVASLLAAAAPSLQGMLHGRRLDEECRRMLAVLQWAPTEAASSGDVLAVWFDCERSEYGVITADASQQTVCRFQLGDGLTVHVDGTQAVSGAPFVIMAWPDGTMVPDTDCRIVLTHPARQDTATIQFDAYRHAFTVSDIQP